MGRGPIGTTTNSPIIDRGTTALTCNKPPGITQQTVDVYGVGSTYSGLYYVDEVTHSFTAGVYRQSFKLERNPTE